MVLKIEAKVTAVRFEERSVAQRTELEKLKTETKRLARANEGLSTRLRLRHNIKDGRDVRIVSAPLARTNL
jgi:hypothetical protein